MAGKRRRARMERALSVGVTIRARPADTRRDIMRLAETLPAELLARAMHKIRAFLAHKPPIQDPLQNTCSHIITGMPLPLEATPTDPIQYAAVVALLSMMRAQMSAAGNYDADFTTGVRGRNVRPSVSVHPRERTAMPASEWASLMASR